MEISIKEKSIEVFKVEEEEDLDVRVHRSSSCEITFSPIDVKMESTKNTKPFISNVEGLLKRLKKVLSLVEDSEEKREILNYINGVEEGEKELLIKLKDPRGESYIGD